MEIKEKISFKDFLEIEKKLDIRIGQVMHAERVAKSDKLLKLTVMFGVEASEEKTVVTNIGDRFEVEELLDVSFPFIVNLEPVKMMGITSEAMIMIGNFGGKEILEDYPIGTKIL